MESFGITRQTQQPPTTAEASFTNHIYPFATLPPLTSHVNPKFAILHLGSSMGRSKLKPGVPELIEKYPLIWRCIRLARNWSRPTLPRGADRDPTFVPQPRLNQQKRQYDSDEEPPYDEDDEDIDDDEWESSDGDSICTPPRRIRFRKVPIEYHSRKRPSEYYGVDLQHHRPVKVPKIAPSSVSKKCGV